MSVDYCEVCGEHYTSRKCKKCLRRMCYHCKQPLSSSCRECYFESLPPLSDDEEDVLRDINERISRRVRLGLREEEVERGRSTLLRWSNAGSRWHTQTLHKPRGAVIKLDANELVVPYPNSSVKKMAELGLLARLPLYYRSTEAFERQEAIDPDVLEDVLEGLEEEIADAKSEEE